MNISETSSLQNGLQIPNPPRLPVIGNLHQLSSNNPAQHFMALMEKYGEILRIYTPLGNMVVVKSYKFCKELCDETRFTKNLSRPLVELRDVGGDGLFTAWTSEPNWQKAHNILIPGLGQRAMKGYFPMMYDIAERLLAKWHNIPEEQEFNLTDDMTRLTFDTIGLCGFDYRFHSFASPQPHPFIEAMVTALEDSMKRMNKIGLQRKLRFRSNYHYQKSLNYMFKVVDDIIAERQADPEKYKNNTDFMSLMLNATDLESGEKLDPINIRYQILTFLIAGHETTSGLLSFAFYYLMTNPEVARKAYKEVDTVLGNDLSQTPDYSQINDLKYIQQILNESLRLWPTAPAFSVYANEDTTLGNYQVPKKQPFIVLLPGLHRDPAVWGPDADKFNPDNFTPEAMENRPAEAFKPFGNGQRACIGRQFALLEATLVMGLILQRYELKLKDGYELVVKETLTLKPDNLMVSLKKRKDADRYYAPKVAKEEKVNIQHDSRFSQNPLTVAYGSNMGASEDFALQIAQEAERLGFPCVCEPLDDLVKKMPKEGSLIIITATYNGTPPNNAQKFETWLEGLDASKDFKNLKYAVFGCGNTQWKTFQVFPRWIDEKLEKIGAKRLLEKGEADAAGSEFEEDFQEWQQSLWQKLHKESNEKPSTSSQFKALYQLEKQIDIKDYKTPFPSLRQGEQTCKVIANQELQSLDSGRSTRHIEIALPQDMTYQTGDHLGVYPQNSKQVIERVCRRFNVQKEDIFTIQTSSKLKSHLPIGKPVSVEDLLMHFVELQSSLTSKQLQILIDFTECPPEKISLQNSQKNFKTEVQAKNLSLLDILEDVPACEIPFEVFLEMLPAMQVRYFSISSSAKVQPQQCSLTVGVIDEPAYSGKGNYYGVCTNYLKKVIEGESILAFVQNVSSPFRLPDDISQKTIMIGPGTGLSPLRAFVQELNYSKAEGENTGECMLFFGCRHPEQDYIYQKELKKYEQNGVIELQTAFSRLNKEKEYVQHRLLAQQDKILTWLKEDAIVYVCGDAASMSPQVQATFKEIYQNQNPESSATQAQAWLENLIQKGQYREDVWA
jgi:cytochrome P450/NADPH-cytochrome P450 reductase